MHKPMRTDRMDWQIQPTTPPDAQVGRDRLRADIEGMGLTISEAKLRLLWRNIRVFRASANSLDRPSASQRGRVVSRIDGKLSRLQKHVASALAAMGGAEIYDDLRLEPKAAAYVKLHEVLSQASILLAVIDHPAPEKKPRSASDEGREGPIKKGAVSRLLTEDALFMYSRLYHGDRSVCALVSEQLKAFVTAVFRAAGHDIGQEEAREKIRDVLNNEEVTRRKLFPLQEYRRFRLVRDQN